MKFIGWIIVGVPIAIYFGATFWMWLFEDKVKKLLKEGKTANEVREEIKLTEGRNLNLSVLLMYVLWIGLGFIIFL